MLTLSAVTQFPTNGFSACGGAGGAHASGIAATISGATTRGIAVRFSELGTGGTFLDLEALLYAGKSAADDTPAQRTRDTSMITLVEN